MIGIYSSPFERALIALCSALLPCCAGIGRGMYRGAFNVNSIQQVMSELLDAAAMPMLTDVKLIGSNLPADYYPAPIPDLCLGQPLLVAGKFMGHSPTTVSVQGMMTGHTGRTLQLLWMRYVTPWNTYFVGLGQAVAGQNHTKSAASA